MAGRSHELKLRFVFIFYCQFLRLDYQLLFGKGAHAPPPNFAETGIFGNLMSFVFNLSGAIMFQELIQTGGAKERRQLQELQRELQSDDPINIQFTSVSKRCILNTTSILESTKN